MLFVISLLSVRNASDEAQLRAMGLPLSAFNGLWLPLLNNNQAPFPWSLDSFASRVAQHQEAIWAQRSALVSPHEDWEGELSLLCHGPGRAGPLLRAASASCGLERSRPVCPPAVRNLQAAPPKPAPPEVCGARSVWHSSCLSVPAGPPVTQVSSKQKLGLWLPCCSGRSRILQGCQDRKQGGLLVGAVPRKVRVHGAAGRWGAEGAAGGQGAEGPPCQRPPRATSSGMGRRA